MICLKGKQSINKFNELYIVHDSLCVLYIPDTTSGPTN